MSTIYRVNGIWQYAWVENGRRRKKSLKVRDRGVARILQAKLDIDLSRNSAGLPTDTDLQEFFECYKATHYAGHKPRNAIKEIRILKRFVSGIGADRLSQISTDAIQAWLTRTKVGPKTWNNIRGAVRTFLDAAVPRHLDKNPAVGVLIQKVPDKHVDFYTDDEYHRIEAAAGAAGPALRDMVVLARYTGLRIGEILHLEGGDLVWSEKPLLYVKNKPHFAWTVKNYQIRAIPLSRAVCVKLAHLRSKQGLLFPNANGGIYKNYHETALNEVLKACKLKRPGRAWHLLRHTFASRAVQNGVPLPQIMRWLGHGDYRTTLRYAHLAPEYSAEIEKINPRTATDSATAVF